MTRSKSSLYALLTALLLLGQLSGCATYSTPLFSVRFIDSETGRGIPLVEIETTHGVTYVSDSMGYIAIDPFNPAGQEQYFNLRSHGYVLEEQAQPMKSLGLNVRPGDARNIRLTRKNIAERLYRITGEGIYHHAIKLRSPRANGYQNIPLGGVYGQDSASNAIYGGRLYWFWGDTLYANTPFGNFSVSGATSPLPSKDTEPPSRGVELSYFVDSSGRSRKMLPLKGEGAVWISGLTALSENGKETMFCHYQRMGSLKDRLEHGLAVWNDQQQLFEKVLELPLNAQRHPSGHVIKHLIDGQYWLYYGYILPDRRVMANQHLALDPSQYEVYSFLRDGAPWDPDNPPILRDQNGALDWQWRKDAQLVDEDKWRYLLDKGLVTAKEDRRNLIDAESGEHVAIHHGHIAWNAFRQRWILLTVQAGGHSPLGEVWYAEAHAPTGPWSPATKIVTHDKYSFYNVKQHPYFAEDNYIYFEGTYTKSFSGNPAATPRYDYNQIMYRLDLDDMRLSKLKPTSAIVAD